MAPSRKRKKVEPAATVENLPVSSVPYNNKNLESPYHQALSIKEHVFNANLTARRELREQLRQLRHDLEDGRQSGKDPLYLFPQEIWLMIISNLEDINDLAHCAQSCTLFATIIGPLQEVLFGKVLPFLLPYLSYQSGVVVTCGQVCQKWRSGVDRFADSVFRMKSPISTSLEALTKEVEPYHGDTMRTPVYQVVPELGAEDTIQIGAPFLIVLQLSLSSRQLRGPPNRLSTLDLIGRLAWLLNLELGPQDAYNTTQLYSWCAKAIGTCRNLRTFWFSEEKVSRATIVDNGVGNEVIEEIRSESLEILEFMVDNPNLVPVQDELLRNLSDQLKCLKVSRWNDQLYHKFPWTQLTEIQIVHDSRSSMLTSLALIKAPKLHKLSVKMDSSCDCTQLFKVLNNFEGSLRHLVILLTRAFNPESVLSVPVELLTGNGIHSLEIIAHNLNQSRNIPVLFPLVRNLSWWSGPWVPRKPETFNDPKTKLRFKKPGYHFFQIFNNMYKSNVWTALPQLQNLTMGYAAPWTVKQAGRIADRKVAKEIRTFGRVTYLWETEKYREGITDLLERIQSVVIAEVKEAVKAERESLERMQIQTRNKVRLRKSPQKKMTQWSKEDKQNLEQVFPFLVPFLADSDLLACRLVCKSWKNLMGDQFQRTSDLLFIGIPMTQGQHENFTLEINDNRQNPFFAHSVHLQLNKGTDKAKEVQKLLQKLGTHIRHLTISSIFSLSLVDIYKIFTKCIKWCTNLESLSLHIKVVKGGGEKEFKKLVEGAIPLALPKSFETLSISGPDATYNSVVLNIFMDEVKDKCRNQITILRQDQSSKLCAVKYSGKMPKLKELFIRKFSTDVGSLLKSKWHWPVAPNLNKLHICVTGQKISYRDLIFISKHYQKLEFLELQFTEACGGFAGCLKYCDPSKILLKITELKIVFKTKSQICLDFLVLFPHIKSLRIVYGQHVRFFNEESNWQPKISYGDLKPMCSLPERKPENDYIQLVKHLKDEDLKEHDRQGIHGSNVWTVLRRLRELKLVYCATEQKTERNSSRVFYRNM